MPKPTVMHASRAMLVTALALVFAAPAFAQSTTSQGDSSATTSPGAPGAAGAANNTNSKVAPAAPNTTTTSSTATMGTTGASAQRGSADNTNARVAPASPSADLNNWAGDHAKSNKGRVSRDAYLKEMGRRWDSHDQGRQGLTPAEVSRMTGETDVDSSRPARTGNEVAPGNMGPGSVKAQ